MRYPAVSFSAFVFSNTVFAEPPGRASIEQFLADTQADKVLTSIQQQVDGMMQNTVQQATRGRQVSLEKRKFLDASISMGSGERHERTMDVLKQSSAN